MAQPNPDQKEDPVVVMQDDEPDDWEKRIFSTGCSDENMKLTDCYYDKKDWRACRDAMKVFRECWKRNGNIERTDTKDV